jgi:hypothetical protein
MTALGLAPTNSMQRKIVIGLSVACLLLAILSGYLAYRLYSQSRFTTTQSTNPYIMFDKKTAQACWSGPPAKIDLSAGVVSKDPYKLYDGFWDPATNSANLPFCKDLK